MTSDERARIVCARVDERIREIAPPGLGRWGPSWLMVAEPSDAFLDALSAWLEKDTPETREPLQAAADELVRAWRRAGERWKVEGREAAEALGREA